MTTIIGTPTIRISSNCMVRSFHFLISAICRMIGEIVLDQHTFAALSAGLFGP